MSSHIGNKQKSCFLVRSISFPFLGVSCDACLKTNFSNRRYKCLICDNYDLCGSCYDINAESQNHLNTHPMQCILTKTAYGFSFVIVVFFFRSLSLII